MIELIKDVEKAIEKEKAIRKGKLINLKKSSITVIGDLHGDLFSLNKILDKIETENIVFLGDYADRGPFPIEVYEKIFELKIDHPDKVFLLRGNHEAPDIIPFYPHDFPWYLREKYGENWRDIYNNLIELYNKIPIAVIIDDFALLLHGGISNKITIDSLIQPDKEDLEIILWSDPSDDINGIIPSDRGAGVIFGPDVTSLVLNRLNVKYLIRSHQSVMKGYKWNHNNKVLTIFSAKNVYDLDNGAYLVILNDEMKIITF
ncbi:MAG: metallophosphoesterase [Candidatus Methanomethylicia archaeon]|jgi:protein phosphatase|nr:metallophosphoesterase [Candidatus Methanomethylicia archaeon]